MLIMICQNQICLEVVKLDKTYSEHLDEFKRLHHELSETVNKFNESFNKIEELLSEIAKRELGLELPEVSVGEDKYDPAPCDDTDASGISIRITNVNTGKSATYSSLLQASNMNHISISAISIASRKGNLIYGVLKVERLKENPLTTHNMRRVSVYDGTTYKVYSSVLEASQAVEVNYPDFSTALSYGEITNKYGHHYQIKRLDGCKEENRSIELPKI